jgi:diguanylate cyclase (GGDEF)-like protein
MSSMPEFKIFSFPLDEELEVCRRYKGILSGISIGIDYQSMNLYISSEDQLSIIANAISTIIKKRFRKSDIAARTGRGEFIVVLPATGIDDAIKMAEQFIDDINKKKFRTRSKTFSVTCSCGVTDSKEGEKGSELFERCRKALDIARTKGNMQVHVIRG